MDLALVERPLTGLAAQLINEHSVPLPANRVGPKELRSVHMQMAILVAKGLSVAEVAAQTGYSVGYVGFLKSCPAFAELVTTYHGMAEIEFIENEKLKAQLNRTAMEVAQERLTLEPEKIANKDLISLIKETSVQIAPQGPAGAAPPTQIQVNFFSKQPQARAISMAEVIEGEVRSG